MGTRALVWAAPLLLACLVYTAALRIGQPVVTGDQPHYALEAHSLAFDGDRDLADDYANYALVHRVSGAPSLTPHAYRYTPGAELVSFHGVGLPLLLAPAALIGDGSVIWMQLEMIVVGGLAAQVLFGILRRLVPERRRLRWGVWASVVFGLPLVAYSSQLYPELPAALCVLLVIRLLLAQRLPAAGLVACGAAAGALPWLHARFGVIAAGLALLAAARALRQRRGEGVASVARALAALAVPLVLSLAGMVVAYQHWYGSPLPTAMAHTPAPPVAAPVPAPATGGTAAVAASGSTFSLGDVLSGGTVYLGVARSLFSAKTGWLPFAPVGVLGVAFLVALCVRRRPWAIAGLAVALAYLVAVAAVGTLPGASLPPRYEVVLAPLVAIPLLLGAERLRWVRWLWIPLAVASLAIAAAGVDRMAELLPTADPAARPDLGVAAALLRPWPTVTRAPIPGLRVRWLRQRSARHPIGAAGPRGEQAAPAEAGVLSVSRPVRLSPGEYRVGVPLGRIGNPAPGTASEVLLVGPGGPVARASVAAGALPSRAMRGFEYRLTVASRVRMRVVVRSTGTVGLAAGDEYVRPGVAPTTGLGTTGTRYPDVPWVVGWALAILALGVAMAMAASRPPMRCLR